MGEGILRSDQPVVLSSWNKLSIYRDRWDAWMQLNNDHQVGEVVFLRRTHKPRSMASGFSNRFTKGPSCMTRARGRYWLSGRGKTLKQIGGQGTQWWPKLGPDNVILRSNSHLTLSSVLLLTGRPYYFLKIDYLLPAAKYRIGSPKHESLSADGRKRVCWDLSMFNKKGVFENIENLV